MCLRLSICVGVYTLNSYHVPLSRTIANYMYNLYKASYETHIHRHRAHTYVLCILGLGYAVKYLVYVCMVVLSFVRAQTQPKHNISHSPQQFSPCMAVGRPVYRHRFISLLCIKLNWIYFRRSVNCVYVCVFERVYC